MGAAGIKSQISIDKGIGGWVAGRLGQRPFPHLFEVATDDQGVVGVGLIGQRHDHAAASGEVGGADPLAPFCLGE